LAYDSADWHYGGDFPKDLLPENGSTHIGMFLAWAIIRKLVGDLHVNDSQVALVKVKNRQVTGRDFFISQCDGKFWKGDLSDEGNAFAANYYVSNIYIDDYLEVMDPNLESLYHVADSWENFDRIAPVIDKRFDTWKNPPKKSWWKLGK
jgi:hypothetical protein